jgi:hypothetical protein
VPRKPSALLQYKLRIRESLRRRIEQAAKKRGVSANYEMTSRLERSFEQEAARSIDMVAGAIEIAWARHEQANHVLGYQGDLTRASEALLQQIDGEEGNSEAVKAAADKLRKVIKIMDIEAANARRRASTTGEI